MASLGLELPVELTEVFSIMAQILPLPRTPLFCFLSQQELILRANPNFSCLFMSQRRLSEKPILHHSLTHTLQKIFC